jgi:hypothetical protein
MVNTARGAVAAGVITRLNQRRASLAGIFAPGIARTTFFASLLAIGAQSGYYALFTWMPTYLTKQRHMLLL